MINFKPHLLLLLAATALGAQTCPTGQWYAEYFPNEELSGVPLVTRCEAGPPNFDANVAPPPAGIDVDSFSARWSAAPTFPAGPTLFTTVSDDGIRLFVDGVRVINDWTYHAPTTDKATVNLTAGAHKVVLEFMQGGGWAIAKLTYGAAPALAIRSFTASPATITTGASSTLSWQTDSATTCSASGGWTGLKATSGSQKVTPAATTTYTLTCSDAAGKSVSASATVAFTALVPQITGFTATPSTIDAGASTTLSWTAANAPSCTASGAWSGTKALTGTQSVAPSATSTYTLTCGTAYASVKITVNPVCVTGQWKAEYFAKMDLTGTPIIRCEAAAPNYDWGTTAPIAGLPADGFSARWTGTANFNAGPYTFTTYSDDGIRVLVDGAPVINDWTFHSAATDTGVVTLTAGAHRVVVEFFDGGGAGIAQVSWKAGTPPPPPPAITSFTASPTTIAPGGTASLFWQTTNAANCTASGAWSGSKSANGSEPVAPATSAAYTLTCTNTAGATVSATAIVTVTGTPGPPAPLPQVTGLTATRVNGNVNLTWNAATVARKWVSAYYLGYFWDWTGQDPNAALATVDMSALTHFIFARYSPGGGGLGGNYGQLLQGAGTAHQMVEAPFIAKAHAAGVKAIMMVGGAGDGQGFDGSTAAASARAAFVQAIVNRAVQMDYDGVDIDWEENLSTPAQQGQVLALLTELRAALNANPRYQSPHAPAVVTFEGFFGSVNYTTVTPWHVQVAALVDQYNLMTYGMSGSYPGWDSWHFSPLSGAGPTTPVAIDATIREYLAVGVPASKLGVGIGFYSLYYHPPVTGPRQGLAGMPGYVESNDISTYYARMVQEGAFHRPEGMYHWDDIAKQSYISYSPAWNRNGSLVSFLSYEDEKSIAAKSDFIRLNGIGGAMIWAINYGWVGGTQGNPLMAAVRQNLMTASGQPAVVAYYVYRNGQKIATVAATAYTDVGVTAGTYTVAAVDAAGNVGPQSSPVAIP